MIFPAFVAALLLQAPQPAELRTAVVSITDPEGNPIEGLKTDDLALLENGVARHLVRVEYDDRPLTVAILVDSSQPVGSAFRLTLVDDVMGFVNRLPAGARYALWTTGDRPTKIVDYTTDRAEALRALKHVVPQGGNTLLDALMEAGRDLHAKEGSRSAIVVITGTGIGFRSYDRRQVVERVRKYADLVLSVQFPPEGVNAAGGGDVTQLDYEYVLDSLARDTGGLHEILLTSMAVDRTLARLSAELRDRYRLTYATLPDLKKRKLEVQVARPDARARVRSVKETGAGR